MSNCPVCEGPAPTSRDATRDASISDCERCGRFFITSEAIDMVAKLSLIDRGRLSGALYDSRKVRPKDRLLELKTDNVRPLLETVPRRISERVDRLLLRIGDQMPHARAKRRIDYTEGRSMAAAANQDEYVFFLQDLKRRELVVDINDIGLSIEGWKRHEELTSARPPGKQVFVAMNFNDDLDKAFSSGLKPGIEDAGYDALRLKELDHAGKIDDRIILEINRSKFMVADFTGQRQSVYYEAGYAAAQGKTVICTVRQDELDTLHFDTRQFAYIDWVDSADLRKRLANRIRALFG